MRKSQAAPGLIQIVLHFWEEPDETTEETALSFERIGVEGLPEDFKRSGQGLAKYNLPMMLPARLAADDAGRSRDRCRHIKNVLRRTIQDADIPGQSPTLRSALLLG